VRSILIGASDYPFLEGFLPSPDDIVTPDFLANWQFSIFWLVVSLFGFVKAFHFLGTMTDKRTIFITILTSLLMVDIYFSFAHDLPSVFFNSPLTTLPAYLKFISTFLANPSK